MQDAPPQQAQNGAPPATVEIGLSLSTDEIAFLAVVLEQVNLPAAQAKRLAASVQEKLEATR